MRRMSLAEWDQKVAPFLGAIQIRAGWVARDINVIREYIDTLPAIPDFATTARDRLGHLRSELAEALKVLDTTIADYDNKPQVR